MYKPKLTLTLFLLLSMPLLTLSGCVGGNDAWQRLDAVEFKDAIDNEQGAFLLDVRTQSEWEGDGHIEGATLIPHNSIESRSSELPEDKSTTILLYCRSGSRSQTASDSLLDLGYTDVRDMDSGINGWKDLNYPVIYGA